MSKWIQIPGHLVKKGEQYHIYCKALGIDDVVNTPESDLKTLLEIILKCTVKYVRINKFEEDRINIEIEEVNESLVRVFELAPIWVKPEKMRSTMLSLANPMDVVLYGRTERF